MATTQCDLEEEGDMEMLWAELGGQNTRHHVIGPKAGVGGAAGELLKKKRLPFSSHMVHTIL
jgi:hypothetical protein